jgi:hypothetical protein
LLKDELCESGAGMVAATGSVGDGVLGPFEELAVYEVCELPFNNEDDPNELVLGDEVPEE